MYCEKCRSELKPTDTVCPHCGTPVPVSIAGFENTAAIQKALKSMMDQWGRDIIQDKNKFISLLNDYIPEYEKERRLLKNMLQVGVLKNMLKETNQKIAIMKAKEYMLSEAFIAENAAEFVMVCFTYMLGWEYVSTLPQAKAEAVVAAPGSAVNTNELMNGSKPAERKKASGVSLDVNLKVFRPADAARFRLRGNVKIPEGYTKIDSFCFDGFGFMRTIQIPDSIVAIGEYAFSECKHLKGVEIPDSVKIIKQGAFSQCLKLAMVKIPNGVFDIEDSTFAFCHNLEIVEIPTSVSSIGAEAFSGCERLRKLFLPESIKFIDEGAFMYCPQLVVKCYENSYVHRYCLENDIKVETVAKGTAFLR